MKTAAEILSLVQYDIGALEDAAALTALGITDADQAEVEKARTILNSMGDVSQVARLAEYFKNDVESN